MMIKLIVTEMNKIVLKLAKVIPVLCKWMMKINCFKIKKIIINMIKIMIYYRWDLSRMMILRKDLLLKFNQIMEMIIIKSQECKSIKSARNSPRNQIKIMILKTHIKITFYQTMRKRIKILFPLMPKIKSFRL